MLSRVARKATVQLCKPCRFINVKATYNPDPAYSPARRSSEYATGTHRSNAEKLINQVPVIEVKDYKAICDGGGGALGHPVEFIDLHTFSDEPSVCKYCGLRYIKAKGKFHVHH